VFSLLPRGSTVVILALAGIWALAYVLGMVLGMPNEDRSRRLARPAKLAMIAVTLVYGALWLRAAAGTPAARYGWLIFGGLLAGAVGDLLLADVFPLRRPELPAMAVFGVGHVLYLAAALVAWRRFGGGQGAVVARAALVAAGAVAAVWWAFIRNTQGRRSLNAGSLLYGMLLGATVAMAAAVWAQTGRMALLAVGMLAFLASDLLLARYLIRRQGFASIRDVVWIIYSAAQVLIAFSIGAAMG
jgi:hypothetical protein